MKLDETFTICGEVRHLYLLTRATFLMLIATFFLIELKPHAYIHRACF